MPIEQGADPPAYTHALALHQKGDLAQAEALYRQATEAGHAASAMNLAVLCLQQGRAAEAVTWATRASEATPGSADCRSTLATALRHVGQTDRAIEVYEDALAIDADFVEAHFGLAEALGQLGRVDEALACCRRALSIDPDYAEAEYLQAVMLTLSRRRDAALAAYQRALDIDETFHEARLGLANLVIELGRHDEGLAHLRRIVAEDSKNPEAQRRLGLALAELGEMEAAAAAMAAAIALQPRAAYFRELSNIRQFAPDDPHLAAMRALAARIETLEVADQIQLHFALGRALSDAGEPQAGFAHLRVGNTLQRQRMQYDEPGTLRLLNDIQAVFSGAFIRAHAGGGCDEAAPIFIVGMPRCGSTLVEQILASHPEVVTHGECPAFGEAVAGLELAQPYPTLTTEMEPADFARLGRDYLARLGGSGRSTDKMLSNSLFVGLIHLALPSARVLHVQRDPVDNCLSCFTELFTHDLPYTYDLGELGRFYRAQAALMQHWERVLPPGVMLTVSYDALVRDFATVTRTMLAHCGLRWDERVRDFHQTRRPVRTASLAQVRRPLYASQKWRPTEQEMRPLLEGLGLA